MARKWFRAHFLDHPGLAAKALHAYAKRQKDKPKTYCKYCFERDVQDQIRSDQEAVDEEQRASVRERGTIEAMLWAVDQDDPTRGWIIGRSDNFLNHLISCELIPAVIRTQAEAEKRGPPTPQDYGIADTMVWRPERVLSTSYPSSSTTSGPSQFHHTIISPTPRAPLVRPQFLHPNVFPLSLPGSAATSPAQSPDVSSFSGSGGHVVLNLSPAPSEFPIPHEHPYKRQRLSRHGSSRPVSRRDSMVEQPIAGPPWNAERQQRYEECIARITASAGFPLNWVHNVEWNAFIKEFLPAANNPSRKVLTRRIIPTVLKTIRAQARKDTVGKNATAQCDGWTGKNTRHFIAFMAATRDKIHTVRVEDVSSDRHTAVHLLKYMIEVIHTLESEWGLTVIAFTTDASGESRKARSLLLKKFPHLVVPDCYAHQINLIVGDYFKGDATFLEYAEKATSLIKWLRKRTAVLALLRDAQKFANPDKPALSVLRAVLTRWTAHYLAFQRLLQLRPSLIVIVNNDLLKSPAERQIISGDTKARQKAQKIVNTINDPVFWHAIAKIKTHLEPLAIAANVTQSSFCRLDEVLLTFGSLYMHYSATLTDGVDEPARDAILESIESRWKKADQDVFIAAVLLNPFTKNAPFRPLPFLTLAGILILLKRLWTRFYAEDPPLELHQNLQAYLNNSSVYEGFDEYATILKAEAEKKGMTPNPLHVYDGYIHPGQPLIPLTKLAYHILGICANSASCERLFSVFGQILTNLRSRLGTGSLIDLAELKMHLREQHLDNGSKRRLKRAFGEAIAREPVQTTTMPTPAPPTIDPTLLTEDSSIPGSNTSASSERTSTSNIRTIYNALIEMNSLDEDHDGPIIFPSKFSETIKNLFDFTHTHWVNTQQRSARCSLDEELEIYELLDLDAEGEPDSEFGLEHSVETILTM